MDITIHTRIVYTAMAMSLLTTIAINQDMEAIKGYQVYMIKNQMVILGTDLKITQSYHEIINLF